MKKWFLIGGGLLFAVAAGGIWFATQNPQWFIGVAAGLGAALWDVLKPGFLKMLNASPETVARNKELSNMGEGSRRIGEKEKPKRKVKANWKGSP